MLTQLFHIFIVCIIDHKYCSCQKINVLSNNAFEIIYACMHNDLLQDILCCFKHYLELNFLYSGLIVVLLACS
jgi:hypothetical protein